ncbi:MAG: TonB-dependent receptor [Pseudomonadota bacterium]
MPIIGSEISSLNGIAKFGWEPNDDHRVEASFQIYRDNGETPPNANVQGTLPTTVAFGSIPNLVDRDIDNKTYRVAWDWTPSDSPLIDLSALVYYNDVSVEEDRLFDGRFNTTDFTTLGFEVTNVSDFDLGPVPVAVSYGIEFYQDQQEARSDGAPRLSTPDATQRFYAAFLQADFEVLPGLTITPGLRYDFYQLRPDGAFQDRDEGQPSPKIAINWQPTDDLQLFASAGRSFRAPTFTELYNDGLHFRIPTFPLGPPGSPVFTGLNLFVPTPDLDPERATQFELGGRYRMRDLVSEGDSLLFAANGYYSIVDGFIDLDVIGVDFATAAFNPITMQVEVNGSSTNQNVDAILFGFEADLEYNSEFWFASAGLSIPRGRARDGGNLGTIPPDRLVLTGGFRPHPDVEIGARASFVDGIEANETSNDPVGGYSVFDIFASWEPSSGPLEGAVFSAGIDNVTDTTYRIQPTEIRQPGLAFKAAASFKF